VVPTVPNAEGHRLRNALPPLPPLRETPSVAQQVVRSCSAEKPAIASLNPLPAPTPSSRPITSEDRIEPDSSVVAEEEGIEKDLASHGAAAPEIGGWGLDRESTEVAETPMPGNQVEASRLVEDGSEQQSPQPSEVLLEAPSEYAVVPEPPQLLTPEMSASATAPALIVSDLPSSGKGSLLPPSIGEERIAVTEPASLHLGVPETRLLRASENIYRVVPENGHVCDVLVFNPREIALISKQQGTMQLDVWYDSQGLRRASYVVTVAGPPAPKAGMHEDMQKIETLIGQLFPGSRIQCDREPNRLIVRGHAVSQRQAVDIVSMVRRSQLIPVVDLIDIRAQEP
jgi:hypothetical protein